MPNYNITIDSRFDPYSFEDYLKPLAILQEQHNQAADTYATALANSAGMEEALAANPDDIDLLNQYNAYRQTLNNLADDLSKNGISRTTRRGAYQAKADYGNIAKMQEAIKQRDEILKERRGLRAQDNSIIFDTDDDSYSIKNVMAGKTNYNMLSQNTVAKAVADQVKNLAKTSYMKDNPEMYRKYGYIIEKMKNGVMPQEVQDLIEGKEPTTEFGRDMKGILDRVVADATGVGNWNDEQLTSIGNYAKRGLWDAIGDFKTEWHQDLELAEARKRAAEAKEYPDYDVIWSSALNAPEGLNILGFDNRQRSRVNNLNDFLNGRVDKVDQYIFGDANANANFENWLKEYGGEKYFKNGKFTDLGKATLVMYGSYFNNVNMNGLTEDEIKGLQISRALQMTDTPTGHATGEQSAIKQVSKIYNKYRKAIKESEFKDLIGEYADYMNKGAVLSEGASFGQIENDDAYLSAILQYAGDPQVNGGRVKLFKGVNKDGYFIDDPSGDSKFYGDILDEKTGKLIDPHTRIRWHRDKSGRLVASVTNKSGKSYALDVTNLFNSNNPEAMQLLDAYTEAQNAYRNYINDIPDSVVQAIEKPKERRSAEEQSLVDKYTRDVQTLKAMTTYAGKKAYRTIFDKFTTILQNRKLTNTTSVNEE